MTGVRVALYWSLTERYLLILLALASNVILARLLTPEEVGIFSVSLAVIGIAQVLRDFGVGNFLIQERNLTDEHVGTAYGISLILGFSFFSVLFFAAPSLADFYAEPRLTTTLRLVAINFLTLPFSSISLALLRREMRFRALMIGALVASLVGFIVTVSTALLGFGANSLALGAILSNITTGAAAWLARSPRRIATPSLKAWREILNFGGQSSVTGVVSAIATDANDLVVGKVLDFDSVAILSRAQSIMNIFHRDLMAAVRNVALPALAGASREERNVDLQAAHGVAIVTLVGWSFYGLVSVFALETVRVLYGPQWDSSADLVPLYCLAGAIAAINSLTPSQLIATGNISVVTKAELVIQPIRLGILLVAVLVWRSPLACAWAYVAATVFGVPYYQMLKHKVIPTIWRPWISAQLKSAVVAVICSMPGFLLQWLKPMPQEQPQAFIPMLCTIVLGIALALPTIQLIGHPLAHEKIYRRAMSRFPFTRKDA